MLAKQALIVFSGLPGAGKSTVASAVSNDLRIPLFAKDHLEAALIRSRLSTLENEQLGYAGYELLSEAASACLKNGVPVALDSVCGRKRIRDMWRTIAANHNAAFIAIECVCPDEELHKSRLLTRTRNIDGWHELDWAEVEKVRGYYESWDGDHAVLDSRQELPVLIKDAISYIHAVCSEADPR